MAGESDPSVRQRKPEKGTENVTTSETPGSKGTKAKKVAKESVWVDVARTLTLLLFLSCGLSYLVSSGDSFFWSLKVPPKYMRLEWWQSHLVRTQYTQPICNA